VKHAGPDAIERLAPLLAEVRAFAVLSERRPGVFYRKSKAFLHFHEDPKGLFADLRSNLTEDFDRFAVNAPGERADLIERVAARLAT